MLDLIVVENSLATTQIEIIGETIKPQRRTCGIHLFQKVRANQSNNLHGGGSKRYNTKLGVLGFLKRSVPTLGVIYLVVCSVLWSIQGFLIFHPVSSNYEVRNTVTEYEVLVDETKDVKSRGLIVNPTSTGPVILFFTGNAGDAASYVNTLSRLNVPAVLSNYRGYGKSDGRPSEKTILADAKITLHIVRERYPDRPLVLMGSSMGSAVAIRTVDSNVEGVILISPFRSFAHVANRSLLRIFPLRFLMRHKFDTRASLDSLPDSVLVLYSQSDSTIPASESERVLKKIAQADIIVDSAHHNAILGRLQNLQSIRQWLEHNFEDLEPPLSKET